MLTSPPHCRELPIEHRRRTAPVEYFYLDFPQIPIMDLVDNITTTPDMDSLNMAMSIIRGGSEQPLLDLAVMKVEMDSYLIMMLCDFFHFTQVGILLAMTLTTMFFGMVPLIILSQLRNNLDRTSRSRCPLLTIRVLFFWSNFYTSIVVH